MRPFEAEILHTPIPLSNILQQHLESHQKTKFMKRSHPPGNYTTILLRENKFTYHIDRVASGFQSEPGESNTVELHLSGLKGTASNPDLQKFRIINFFVWKIGYIGSLKFGCYYLQYVPASKPFDYV